MRFADEVVPTADLEDVLGGTADVEPKKREIDMAKALIDSLSTDFDPSSYKDEYREELMSLIERKASGEKIVSADQEAPKPTKAPDLMAALEESLAAIKGEELSGGGEKKTGSNGGSKAKSGSRSKSGSSSAGSSASKSKSSGTSRSKSSSKAKSKSKPKAKAAK
jgi:DNA end-binding protein Ku